MNKRLKDSMRCCSVENHRLTNVLRTCDYCTESLEEKHLCYREAARHSGKRVKGCILDIEFVKRQGNAKPPSWRRE